MATVAARLVVNGDRIRNGAQCANVNRRQRSMELHMARHGPTGSRCLLPPSAGKSDLWGKLRGKASFVYDYVY